MKQSHQSVRRLDIAQSISRSIGAHCQAERRMLESCIVGDSTSQRQPAPDEQLLRPSRTSNPSSAPQQPIPPPCFFWNVCARPAAMEKAGRAVCCECAARLRGAEYPLRPPTTESLYLTGRAAAEALDMLL